MNNNQKKLVKKLKSSVTVLNDCVRVKNGMATVSDLEHTIKFKVDIEDGMYMKSFFEQGMFETESRFGMDEFDVPKIGELTELGEIDKDLIKSLKTAKKFVTKDKLRPTIQGVYLGNNEMASTDAHRLFRRKVDNPFTGQILPTKTIDLLGIVNAEMDVYISEEHIVFTNEDYVISSRLIDERYPNYDAVIPVDNPYRFTFDKKQLKEVVKVMKQYANTIDYGTYFKLTGDIQTPVTKVQISAFDLDRNVEKEMTLPVDSNFIPAKGLEEFVIGCNAKFLETILTSIKDDKVTFEASQSNRAMLINSEFLLMPVNLVE